MKLLSIFLFICLSLVGESKIVNTDPLSEKNIWLKTYKNYKNYNTLINNITVIEQKLKKSNSNGTNEALHKRLSIYKSKLDLYETNQNFNTLLKQYKYTTRIITLRDFILHNSLKDIEKTIQKYKTLKDDFYIAKSTIEIRYQTMFETDKENKKLQSLKELLEQLIAYSDDEAGSYMQTELFSAKENENIGDAIKRLKILKESGEVDNIWHCHITDIKGKYIGSVGLEELIIFEHSSKFSDIPTEKFRTHNVFHKTNIKEVVDMVTNYNLTSVPVLNDNNRLVGRITSDDVYDIIQESATEQIYNMAGVNDEVEQEESIYEIGKSRAFWLAINLITAIAASVVIGIFDTTIQSLVALAILMPIVASMGGNAGTQTLTVTVRQMALGDIEKEDAKKTIHKEVLISLANGLLFAVVIGIIAYLWFSMPMLGVVIALSMIINLLGAGFFGAVIPLSLQKMGIDPAIGSTVLLTTVTDVVGFFSFLGLATLILL